MVANSTYSGSRGLIGGWRVSDESDRKLLTAPQRANAAWPMLDLQPYLKHLPQARSIIDKTQSRYQRKVNIILMIVPHLSFTLTVGFRPDGMLDSFL